MIKKILKQHWFICIDIAEMKFLTCIEKELASY